jgi:hypothetical protein
MINSLIFDSIDTFKDVVLQKKFQSLREYYNNNLLHRNSTKQSRYELYNNTKGIITAAGGKELLLQSFVSINLLRYHGCNLPVELFYADEGEMNEVFIKKMKELNVSCINIQSHELFNDYNARNFSIKSIALFLSSFEEVIWMDVDIIPFMNMEELFDDPIYKHKHYLFFPDIFCFGKYQNANTEKTNELMKEFGFSFKVGENETDAGLFVINKNKISQDFIVLNLLFNINHKLTYAYAYGDKELYNLCMKLCGIEYSTNDVRPGIIGKYFPADDLLCGNGSLFKKNDLDNEDSIYCAHMTLHNISHVPKYGNAWTKSIWTHCVIKPIDITLTVVNPLNQELIIRHEYDKKFMKPLSEKLKETHKEMYLLYDEFTTCNYSQSE